MPGDLNDDLVNEHVDEPTTYLESNVLLAIQGGDEAHAAALLRRLTTHELRELNAAAVRLSQLTAHIHNSGQATTL